jgi:lipopolysaccharide export system protein LptA/lipopolysaccharide export system protein LptC
LRNAQASRYAGWAAGAAGVIALMVGGMYAERAIMAARARRIAPPVVPATVQRQSGEFTYSGGEKDHTLYTIRASHATEFRDEGRTLLQDVWVTIYGRDGSRNDNIHTRECSYAPKTGDVRCEAEVQIDIQAAKTASGKTPGNALEVKTRDLSFNRDTGEATSSQPVDFVFPQGKGHGVGIRYSSGDSSVRVEHAVEFDLTPSDKTSGLPVTATGSSLEIRRNDRVMVLAGPTMVREGGRELTAAKISVDLDEDFHARHATAEGHPLIHMADEGGKADVTADKFEALLDPRGWVERIAADGNVRSSRETVRGTDHLATARMDFAMDPEHNTLKEMTATGGVVADSQEGANSRTLNTDSLRVVFSPAQHSGDGPDKQQIQSAETLAPATIVSKTADGTTNLRAKKFVAEFGSDGRLGKLLGHSGAEVRSQAGNRAVQVTTADELAATFGAKGDWDTLEETGNVHFQQADRKASSEKARIDRATDTITMDGSPVISDATSRSTVGSVKINQKTGEIQAGAGVVSTYLSTGKSDAVNLGAGPAHITAESLSGSTASGHVVYRGHARLWQGDSVMDADQVEIWRDERKMQAQGHVVAVFRQEAGGPGFPAVGPPPKASTASKVNTASHSSGPTLWVIHAPLLTYWNDQGKAHLEGGVVASSQDGSLESQTLDVFLSPPPATPEIKGASRTSGASSDGSSAGAGGRQLTRALARGKVLVSQGDRRGTGEQADYTAVDGKFVLSGGNPTLIDASGDTTTGHSLTFYVASDTILIDSESGSRTLSKHRVEK